MEDSQRLSCVTTRTLSNQRTPGTAGPSKILQEADDIEQSKEYDVDKFLGSTRKGRSVLYLVK